MLCEHTGLARDQIVAALGRLRKNGKITVLDNTLHDAAE
jgi:hypothetical protein